MKVFYFSTLAGMWHTLLFVEMALGNELTANNGNGRKGRLVKVKTLCDFIPSQRSRNFSHIYIYIM
jgi:hypothetical protein